MNQSRHRPLREIHVHLGWPLSPWLDRIATGVFVANLIRLPTLYPELRFHLEYLALPPPQAG